MLPGSGPLSRVHPALAFLVVAAVFAAGVLVRGPVGAGLLLVLAAGVALLLVGTWRALPPAHRAGRVLVLALLVVVAVSVL
ncbi:hypothetical protein BJP25_06605 [Actinokineospora bangkokensis]|uniref:Uncharacterized protein n=1 Tax=Actinokineospora bangkokensis TaxID=1193682 RepID=A0A1Q9LU30_9PSEU|nr:hypothetical protein BJP25_06605 [Actinokineospora bangkokensis]